MEKSKQSNMIANNDMNRWCALYTAPRSERKLMQRLNEAGYAAFWGQRNNLRDFRVSGFSWLVSFPLSV